MPGLLLEVENQKVSFSRDFKEIMVSAQAAPDDFASMKNVIEKEARGDEKRGSR